MSHPIAVLEFKKATLVAAALGALALLSTTAARAEPEFPAVVRDVANTPCESFCILCHATNTPTSLVDAPQPYTGRPFYDALFHFGFIVGEDQLRATLGTYAATEVDANADGVCDDVLPTGAPDGVCDVDVNRNGINDILDLGENLNPNDDSELCDFPQYGCGARIEPRGEVEDYGSFLGAFLAMTLLFKTRRRRSPGQPRSPR